MAVPLAEITGFTQRLTAAMDPQPEGVLYAAHCSLPLDALGYPTAWCLPHVLISVVR